MAKPTLHTVKTAPLQTTNHQPLQSASNLPKVGRAGSIGTSPSNPQPRTGAKKTQTLASRRRSR